MNKLQPGSHLPTGGFKFWQFLALFVPFAIIMIGRIPTLAGIADPRLRTGLSVLWGLLFGLLVLIWIAGLLKGFPSWALPSLGLILFIFAYVAEILSQGLVLLATRDILRIMGFISLDPPWSGYWPDSIPLRLLMYAWFNLIYVILTGLMVLGLLSVFRSLRELARKDWSLLSFLLFGLAIPYTFLDDEFRGLEIYEFLGISILALGALLFIILPGRRSRLLALLAAVLLALPVLALGKYSIFPAQEFATPNPTSRVWEALQPVLDLPALLIILCLPILIRWLPDSFGIQRVAPASV